jgi:hypothetical protein
MADPGPCTNLWGQRIRMVGLFTKKHDVAVQNFILKLVNNNCPDLKVLADGPRLERRVNLTIPVLVIPVEKREPVCEQAFTVVSKEFSSTGIGLVLDRPRNLDKVILGFYWEHEMNYVWAEVKHLTVLGGGFYHLGLKMTKMIYVSDYPELGKMSL